MTRFEEEKNGLIAAAENLRTAIAENRSCGEIKPMVAGLLQGITRFAKNYGKDGLFVVDAIVADFKSF